MDVIQVQKIGKLYRLGEIGTGTLSHDLNRWWARVRGKEDPFAKVAQANDRTAKGGKGDYVWALQEVSFSVREGEVVGVIGKNGAGKSTLLKIISRITTPTRGEIRIRGRVASLLEVGTGFHPEMTGRENIFMNGTLMGMTRREIQKKFDDIVDFAGVAKYVDTPVKRYSSGMTVRLGFAVAAFLEPEILIVDEVLAVGDAEFQKRALGKMSEISKEGKRTVLFVSHNMASVQTICTKGLILENGMVSFIGEIDGAVRTYLSGTFDSSRSRAWIYEDAPGNANIRVKGINVRARNKAEGDPIYVNDDFQIEVLFWHLSDDHSVDVTLKVFSDQGILLFVTGSTSDANWHGKRFPSGLFSSTVAVPGHLLNCGKYRVDILFGHATSLPICSLSELICFEILHSNVGRGSNMNKAPGLFRPLFKWETTLVEEGIS